VEIYEETPHLPKVDERNSPNSIGKTRNEHPPSWFILLWGPGDEVVLKGIWELANLVPSLRADFFSNLGISDILLFQEPMGSWLFLSCTELFSRVG